MSKTREERTRAVSVEERGRCDVKRISVVPDNRDGSEVVLSGIPDGKVLTAKMARAAMQMATGFHGHCGFCSDQHKTFRVTRTSAREVYEDGEDDLL